MFVWCAQENDLKRARALKKTEREREVCRDKDAEIQRLRAEIQEQTQICQSQKRAIEKLSVFRKFMGDVQEQSDGEVRPLPLYFVKFFCNISFHMFFYVTTVLVYM